MGMGPELDVVCGSASKENDEYSTHSLAANLRNHREKLK